MSKRRNTVQKQTVYEGLCALGHPSATELYEYLHATHPAISRGTVFRVLRGFASEGMAKRLSFEGSDERFDATLTPHAHACCRVCGKVSDVPLPDRFFLPAATEGFTAETVSLEYYGLCAACKLREQGL